MQWIPLSYNDNKYNNRNNMNFIKLLSIVWVLLLSANQVFALSYKDTLPTNSWFKSVSQSDIWAAKLLQDYVKSYRDKINSLLDSYNAKESLIIELANDDLKQMSRSLDIIQYKSVNPDVVNDVMKSIVSDLKTLNNRMKIYLEQEKILHKERVEQIKIKYIKIWSKISLILDNIILSLSNSLIEKETLSSEEKSIVRSLVVIRQQNEKITAFKNIEFHSEQEMKDYFRNIINILRTEIISIKNISR